MANVWRPNRGYSILKPYVNFCCKSIFSRVRVSGLENVPTDGYVMYAPNHCATLMDPLLLLTTRRGPIAFGARYDIFRNPRVAKMLNWMRILPLARERDGLKSVSTNFETFDDIVDCLGHGVPFCMFSEGRHRPERGMLPVKKGIFRVCKLALDRLGGPVYIVPVGLDYQYFFRQGGSVDLRIGKPIDIEDYMTRGETAGEAAAYRELCEVLQQRILALIGKVPERKGRMLLPRLLAALVLLPLTLATCILSLPIWLPVHCVLVKMSFVPPSCGNLRMPYCSTKKKSYPLTKKTMTMHNSKACLHILPISIFCFPAQWGFTLPPDKLLFPFLKHTVYNLLFRYSIDKNNNKKAKPAFLLYLLQNSILP